MTPLGTLQSEKNIKDIFRGMSWLVVRVKMQEGDELEGVIDLLAPFFRGLPDLGWNPMRRT